MFRNIIIIVAAGVRARLETIAARRRRHAMMDKPRLSGDYENRWYLASNSDCVCMYLLYAKYGPHGMWWAARV